MAKILISYRREDGAAYAGRVADRLRQHFGSDNVFIDIDTIRPGDDFVSAIEGSVRSCDAVVAVIGPEWSGAVDTAGRRRLERPDDFVRLEIATALQRGIRVVPALVDGATMPAADELPPDLAGLSRRQALDISDHRFHHDVSRLIEALSDGPPASPHAGPEHAVQVRSTLPQLARGLTRRRRALVVGAVMAVVLLGLGTLVTWSRWFAGYAPAVAVPAAEASSPGAPVQVSANQIYAVQLPSNGEAYFSLSETLHSFRIVLDARCSKREKCVLSTALAVLDADGAVVENRAIQFHAYDVAYRRIRAIDSSGSAGVQVKIVNDSSDTVDHWLTVIDAKTSGVVPLFGDQRPQPLTIREERAGSIEPGQAGAYAVSLKRGTYAVTLDLSVSPLPKTVLSGYVAIVANAGGDEAIATTVHQYAVSHRSTGTLDVAAEGVHVVRVQNDGSSSMNYRLAIAAR